MLTGYKFPRPRPNDVFVEPKRFQNLRMRIDQATGRVPFNNLYEFQEMGPDKLVMDYPTRHERIRKLAEHCTPTEIMICGKFTLAIYNPREFNRTGLEYVLNRAFEQKELPFDNHFTQEARRQGACPDAWLDWDHGLYLTFKRVDLNDMRRSLKLCLIDPQTH